MSSWSDLPIPTDARRPDVRNRLLGRSIVPLSARSCALRAGDVARPEPGSITLFCSVGLAGTEAFLLDRLATSINGQ